MAGKTYTVDDFYKIEKDGFDFSLPPVDIGRFMAVVSVYDSTYKAVCPCFKKQVVHASAKDAFKEPGVLWKNKVTRIIKDDGTNGKMNEIRLHLNKISDKSFDTMQTNICEILDVILADHPEHEPSDEKAHEERAEYILKIGNSIFDVASQNRFYSKLYAKLYATLISKYPVLEMSFQSHCDAYLSIFDNITYVDSDEDYDQFCVVNKINEKRRATSLFFINLTVFKIITRETMTQMVCRVIEKFAAKLLDEASTVHEIDEYIENIIILYDKACIDKQCIVKEVSVSIAQYIEKLMLLKPATCKNLSNKSMFKLQSIKK